MKNIDSHFKDTPPPSLSSTPSFSITYNRDRKEEATMFYRGDNNTDAVYKYCLF